MMITTPLTKFEPPLINYPVPRESTHQGFWRKGQGIQTEIIDLGEGMISSETELITQCHCVSVAWR